MNQIDYEQLMIGYFSNISDCWEIWLALTFAFIVAIHAGRESITKLLLGIGCFLYAGASVATTLRYVSATNSIGNILQSMNDAGFESVSFIGYGFLISPLTQGIMFGGTIVAIFFAIIQYRAKNDT